MLECEASPHRSPHVEADELSPGCGGFVFFTDHCCFSLFIGIDVVLNVDKFLRFTVSRWQRREENVESTFIKIYIPPYVVYISLWAIYYFRRFAFLRAIGWKKTGNDTVDEEYYRCK